MKVKFGSLIHICFFTVSVANAQTLIPRAGFTLSTTSDYITSYDSDPTIKFSSGFVFGLGCDIPLKNKLSFQPEVLWIQKGNKTELKPTDYYIPSQGYNFRIEFRDRFIINYIEVPLLLKMRLGKVGSKVFFTAGPSIAYGLDGKRHYHTSYSDPTGSYYESFVSDIKYDDPPKQYSGAYIFLDNRLDIGMQAGFGALVFKRIIVEFRYSHSLTSYSDAHANRTAKNRVAQFMIGIPIKLKKNNVSGIM